MFPPIQRVTMSALGSKPFRPRPNLPSCANELVEIVKRSNAVRISARSLPLQCRLNAPPRRRGFAPVFALIAEHHQLFCCGSSGAFTLISRTLLHFGHWKKWEIKSSSACNVERYQIIGSAHCAHIGAFSPRGDRSNFSFNKAPRRQVLVTSTIVQDGRSVQRVQVASMPNSSCASL